jgi:hypothetical protein
MNVIWPQEVTVLDVRSIQPTNQYRDRASKDGVAEVAEHLELLKEVRS